MHEIRLETKDNGSWSQYIEVGDIHTDSFGDAVFTRKGYAQRFPGLGCQRKTEGRGAAQRTRWILEVPDGFPHVIRKVTNPGGGQWGRTYEVVYHPEEETPTT